MVAVAGVNNSPTGGVNTQPVQPSLFHSALRSLIVFTVVQFFSRKYGLTPPVPETLPPMRDAEAQHPNQPATIIGDAVDTMNVGGGSTLNTDVTKRKPSGATVPPSTTSHNHRGQRSPPRPTGCLWPPASEMSLHVYVTDVETIDPLLDCTDFRATDRLLAQWHERDLHLHPGDTPGHPTDGGTVGHNERHVNLTVSVPRSVRFNETHVYAHVCLLRVDTSAEEQSADSVLHKTFALTKHRRRRRIRDEKNLLAASDDDAAGTPTPVAPMPPPDKGGGSDGRSPLTIAGENRTHDQVLLYLKPSFTLQMVNVHSMAKFPNRQSIPHQMAKYMDWKEEDMAVGDYDDSSATANTGPDVESFYPILYNSEFWIQTDSLIEINDTMTAPHYHTDTDTNSTAHTVTLEMHLHDVNMWRWQFMSQMEESWRVQEDLDESGGGGGSGMDVLRTMLLETNPVLLAITAVVSVLHTLFDILAFKNDIKFFKGKRSMEGISLRSMVVGVVSQLVILLYLMDNETSFMVLMSNGVGVAIECWKITKAVDITVRKKKEEEGNDGDGDGEGSGMSKLQRALGGWELQWEEKEGYKGSKTKEYDEIATSHLMYITMPLVTGFGAYSLLHQKHKGWYSWILNTLVGFIYMFGFVMMTPQLFINYKLQSVAHLNWRTLTYKSINTFIDDLFAFVIKMPIMHRLACLRDDVIFFIFCYQRYRYRTDYTRVNEFGQCERPTAELLEERRREQEEGTVVGDGGVGEPVVVGPRVEEVDALEAPAGVEVPVTVAAEDGAQEVRRRRGARERSKQG